MPKVNLRDQAAAREFASPRLGFANDNQGALLDQLVGELAKIAEIHAVLVPQDKDTHSAG
jgi:hypothetical protein